MIDFHPLASSSAGCAYLLSAPGLAPLLVDAGLSFREIQQATGFKAASLAGCLVSHAHGDHVKAVPELLKASVDVYASEGTWKQFQKGKFDGHHRAHVIKDLEVYDVAGWQVKPFEVVHDAEETMGFLIRGGEDLLLYLTDTAYSPKGFDGMTILAVEANWGEDQLRENLRNGSIDKARFGRTASSHMSIERLKRMLKANDLSKVREIHLLHLSDANSDEREFKEDIQKLTGIPTFIAAKRQEAEF